MRKRDCVVREVMFVLPPDSPFFYFSKKYSPCDLGLSLCLPEGQKTSYDDIVREHTSPFLPLLEIELILCD